MYQLLVRTANDIGSGTDVVVTVLQFDRIDQANSAYDSLLNDKKAVKECYFREVVTKLY